MTTRLAFIVFGVALALRVVHSCIFLAIRTWSSPATNTHRLLLYLLFHISFPRDHTKSSEERQQREGELPHRRHTLCANSYRDRIDYAPHARDHWIFSIKDISFDCASRRHTISVIVCLCRNVSLSTRSFWPNGGWSDDASSRSISCFWTVLLCEAFRGCPSLGNSSYGGLFKFPILIHWWCRDPFAEEVHWIIERGKFRVCLWVSPESGLWKTC